MSTQFLQLWQPAVKKQKLPIAGPDLTFNEIVDYGMILKNL